MTSIPSRTRSLRKPGDLGSRYDRSAASEPSENNAPLRRERNSQSPSRLPTKPPIVTRNTRSSSTTPAVRPPSATGSVISNASMRPPPPRANISKPTSSGLHRSGSNRQPSAKQNTPPAQEADPVKKDRSRPPITTSRHVRNASASSLSGSTKVPSHTRTRSSSTLLSASTALPPPSRNAANEIKLQTPAEQLRRPAFSTLQQHFSPAKNLAPKPHPASFLAPPSPSKLPSNIAISAETSKLQNELLQLHLLHKDAARVEGEWKASAKRKLGARFYSVVDKNEELIQLEIAEAGKINASALKKWQDFGTPGWGLDEKVQILDEVITGIWNLGDIGGKYARAVKIFERWLRRTQEILVARERGDGLHGDEVVFLEELEGGWRDDCLFLGRKLEIWRNQLKDIGTLDEGSSLVIVVDGCEGLVKGMLQELALMIKIESDAVRMEAEWIKSMNDDAMDDDNNMPVAGAVWRSL